MQKIKTDKMLSQLGHLNDEQFKVLFFIYNSINLNSDNTNRVKIYRAVLADLTGKSERTISRITDKLAEQGLIIKDSVSDGSKLYNYYGIPKQKIEGNFVTDDRVKELKEHKSTKSIESTKSTESTEKKENIEKTDEYEAFQKTCESLLECKTENELITKRASIASTINKRRIEIPRNVYSRCMSYLDRRYNELSQLVMAEASADDDMSFLD